MLRVTVVAPFFLALAAGCSEPDAPVLTPLVMTPSSATLRVGDTLRFNAGVDNQVVWHSSEPFRVSINETGLATAVAGGSAMIWAVRGSETVSGIVTVVGCSIPGITISPPHVSLAPGDSALFRTKFEGCVPLDVGYPVTWTTSNPALATAESRDPVDGWQTAMVHAHAVGQVVVVATAKNDPTVSSAAALTVRAP